MAGTGTPAIDLVLPARNVGPWLAECLESLRSQTFADWQAHIVLDRSDDDTEQIADRLAARDARIRVHSSPQQSVGAARNYGLTLGAAPLVMFVDADDLLPPNALTTLAAQIGDSDLAAGRAMSFGAGAERPYWTTVSGLFDSARQGISLADEPRLVLDHTIWNKLYRRSFLIDNGIVFDESAVISEDAAHSIASVCAASSVTILTEVVYRHRERAGSLSSAVGIGRALEDWARLTGESAARIQRSGSEAALALFCERFLETEAFTRVRSLDGGESPAERGAVISLIATVISLADDDVLARLPALQRLSYAAIGLLPAPPLDVSGLFTPWRSVWQISGPELHARLWRDALLHPFLAVAGSLSAAQRTVSAAIATTVQARYVADFALSATDRRLTLLLVRGRVDDAVALRAVQRAVRAEAGDLRVGVNDIHLLVSCDGATGDGRLVARSRGAIGGITVDVATITEGTAPTPVTLHHRDLRPTGDWSLAVVWGDLEVQLTRVGPLRGTAPTRLRRIWVTAADGSPLTVATRGPLARRLAARATSHARRLWRRLR